MNLLILFQGNELKTNIKQTINSEQRTLRQYKQFHAGKLSTPGRNLPDGRCAERGGASRKGQLISVKRFFIVIRYIACIHWNSISLRSDHGVTPNSAGLQKVKKATTVNHSDWLVFTEDEKKSLVYFWAITHSSVLRGANVELSKHRNDFSIKQDKTKTYMKWHQTVSRAIK